MGIIGTRRERVILDLQDDLSPGLLRATAAAKLLDRELDSLGRSSVQTARVSRDIDAIAPAANRADKSINQLTGRLRVLAEVAAILAPSLAPIGAVAVPAITGLASQLGFAAIAGGVLMGSMRGLGTALDAMNKADLEPTTENLAKAEDALNALAPAAREFAKEIRAVAPGLKAVRDIGAEALVPGLTESLDDLERLGPRVAAIFDSVGAAIGGIAADGAASLASDRWTGFFEFIAEEAPEALVDLSATIGSITHAMAEMWQTFDPLNDDFSGWLRDAAADLDSWAQGLSQTQGFADFVDYIRTNGPQVADTMGAIGNAVLQIVEATAPLGGPVLKGLEAVADVVSAIADSDLGTPIIAGVAALSLLNRTMAVTASLSKASLGAGLFAGVGTLSSGVKKGAGSIRSDIGAMSDSMVAFGSNADKAGAAADRMKGRVANLAKGGALLGGLAIATSGAADEFGMANTASLALAGSMLGPLGAAGGGAIGMFMDLASASSAVSDGIMSIDTAIAAQDLTALEAATLRTGEAFAKQEGIIAGLNTGLPGLGSIYDQISGKSDEMAAANERSADATKELEAAQAASAERAREVAIAYARSVGVNTDVSVSALATVKQIEAQAKAMEEARAAAADMVTTFGGLGASLDDSSQSLGDWLSEMEASTGAVADFNDNSIKAAKKGLDEGLIKSLRGAGKEGALRMQQLANGTEAGVERANKAFRGLQAETERTRRVTDRLSNMNIDLRTDTAEEKAAGLRARLEKLGKMKPSPQVDAKIDAAEAALRRVEAYLDRLNGKTSVTFIEMRTVRTNSGKGPLMPVAADGVTVPKTGLPYADRHPYMLADGEEVISNRYGQADAFRADRAAGRIPGYADGGTTGGKKNRRPSGGVDDSDTGIDWDRVADGSASPWVRALLAAQNKAALLSLQAAEAQLGASEAQLSASEVALKAAEDQDAAADKALAVVEAQYEGVKSRTAGLFDIDPLAKPDGPSSIWGRESMVSDPFASLQDIIDRSTAFDMGSAALAARGLDGEAFTYGLGNEDRLAQLAAMSDQDLQRFEDMFNQASLSVATTATSTADRAYGEQLSAYTAAAVATEAVMQAQLAQVEIQTQTLESQTQQLEMLRASVEQLQGMAAGAPAAAGKAAANGAARGGAQVIRRGKGKGRGGWQ